ncbi:DUF362 domain-containing protein [uncultured Mitsuokella sp.]|uniref:DUF362 domain-containing protein n=1 Tax=uncultured Mitsuokella sp. TaxID=453120 RepID=UPI0025E3C9BF|nr:DUF362 domain-containing protein [uncultured Mitsuokella sp.]
MKGMTRRNFVKMAGFAMATAAAGGLWHEKETLAQETGAPAAAPKAGEDGDRYVEPAKRQGGEAVVYFTRDLSAAGLLKAYDAIAQNMTGRVGIKLHTGEPYGPNIIPRPWVKTLIAEKLPQANIVETNTYYEGARYTTEEHRKTLVVNGWDFAPVDIMDEEGTAMLPVKGGKWFTEMSVGSHMLNYDSLLVLTHFKGHTMGGFGGSNKNIGIGCADGRIGKKMIHTGDTGQQWGINKKELMERIAESAKATADHFGDHIAYINVLRNMSVSCDCEGTAAQPVVTPNIGILASTDILAADQASVDLVYALPEKYRHDLVERMVTRHGLRQLSYMKELGMGCDRYVVLDLDHDNKPIMLAEAVKNVKPFQA